MSFSSYYYLDYYLNIPLNFGAAKIQLFFNDAIKVQKFFFNKVFCILFLYMPRRISPKFSRPAFGNVFIYKLKLTNVV